MDPHQRIDAWSRIGSTDHSGFINCVYYDSGRREDYNIWFNNRLPLNEKQRNYVYNAYKLIHSYVRGNKTLFNSDDAPCLEQLADRITKVGLYTSCQDPKVKKLYSFARNLRNLNPQNFEVPSQEISEILPDIRNLMGEYLTLTDVVEILASGQPVAPEIIKEIFSNPNNDALKQFIDKILSFTFIDRTVAYIRTFCQQARSSPKAEEWLSLLLKTMSAANFKKVFDCLLLARVTVETAPPLIKEKKYFSQIQLFLHHHACFSDPCEYNCRANAKIIRDIVNQSK